MCCFLKNSPELIFSPAELPTPAPLIYSDGTDPHESADYKVRHYSLHLFQTSQGTFLAPGCTIKIISISWESLPNNLYNILVRAPEVWLSSVINRNNSQMAFWCTPTVTPEPKKEVWYTGLIGWFPRGADARQCWHHGTEYHPNPRLLSWRCCTCFSREKLF